MAMWDKYHLRNNGIAIKTTMGNLKNSLPDKPNIFIGKIKYIIVKPTINFTLARLGNLASERVYSRNCCSLKCKHIFGFYYNNHDQIDMPADVDNFLHYPYFYKRKPFEYEHEVRAIIDIASILRGAPYEFGKPLKINVKTLIGENSEVILSPHRCQMGYRYA